MSRRTLIQDGLLSLLSGAAIAIGVAWGCLLWCPAETPRPKGRFLSGGHRVTDALSRYGTFDGFAVFELRGVGWEMDHALGSSRRFHHASPLNTNKITRTYAGWPFLCLWGEQRTLAAKQTDWWIISFPNLPWSNAATRSYAPLAPLWPAFMANTALYGALTIVLKMAARSARRSYRRSRGCCPYCGYLTAGPVLLTGQTQCSECGQHIRIPRRRI